MGIRYCELSRVSASPSPATQAHNAGNTDGDIPTVAYAKSASANNYADCEARLGPLSSSLAEPFTNKG
jgi:hypothetical protein